jgi:hypothetical protein
MPQKPKRKSSKKPAQPPALKLERLSIDALTSDPRNAGLHGEQNRAVIAGSLKRFGQQKPIVADAAGVPLEQYPKPPFKHSTRIRPGSPRRWNLAPTTANRTTSARASSSVERR